MPNYKWTITFTQFNQQWSEVWYTLNSSLEGAASGVTTALLRPFVNFRDLSVFLTKVRISDVANNRTSIVLVQNIQGNSPNSGPDVTNTTALVSITEPTYGSGRKVWVRGLADLDVQRNPNSGVAQPSAALLSGINRYISNLVNAAFMIRSNTKIATPPVPPISKNYGATITSPPNAKQVQITATIPTVPQYGYVEIRRADPKIWPGLNGIYQVSSAPNANSMVIDYNWPVGGGPIGFGGYWRPVIYNYGAVQSVGAGLQLFTSRKTGKNTTGGRGARSAVRLRLAQ
jgi:hypothetical protein